MNEVSPVDSTRAGAASEGSAEQYFKLLLSEKEYADREIASNLQSNLKVLGTVFSVIVAGLGWIFSTDTGSNLLPHELGLVLLALVALASIATLMGMNFNGLAFGYIAYKADHLGPRFEALLSQPDLLVAARFIAKTPAGTTIVATTILLTLCQGLLSVVLLITGAIQIWRSIPTAQGALVLFWTAVPLVTLLLLAALIGARLSWAALQAGRR